MVVTSFAGKAGLEASEKLPELSILGGMLAVGPGVIPDLLCDAGGH